MQPKPRYRRGDRIGGRYQVYQALMGGMGEVYLCLDLEQSYPLALKTFQSHYLINQKLREAFNVEVATWIALEKHSNIVRCFYMDIIDNQPFMILEWVASGERRGADLRNQFRRDGMGVRLAMDFAIDICRGLMHAGKKQPGIVHRDLKPENILIAQGPLAKITDFGLAKIVQGANLNTPELKSDLRGRQHLSNMGGTPAYMAPEQWVGEELDARTDIYAVGCILYEMLTGRLPFKPAADGFRHLHLKASVPNLTEHAAQFKDLDHIVATCMAKRKNERFATVDELLQELMAIYQRRFNEMPRPTETAEEFLVSDLVNRGNTYDILQDYDKALADFTRAIELDPANAVTYSNRGRTYSNIQRHEEALADYTHAIELDPTFELAYHNRGLTYTDLKRHEEALASFNQAIKLSPTMVASYLSRGAVYQDLQRSDEALADYNRAIELDPKYAWAYFNRADLHSDAGHYEEALADYTRAIGLDPTDAESHINRGSVYERLRRYEEALSDLNYAIELAPNNAIAYSNRGFVWEMLGCLAEALNDHNHAVQLATSDARCYISRGLAYQKVLRHDEALADFARAIELDPLFAKAYSARGALYAELQIYDKALPDLNRAIQLNPVDARAYANRAAILTEAQFYDQALEDYSRVLQIEPTFPRAYTHRAVIYEKAGRYAEALADHNRAIELDSTDAVAYFCRGRTLEKLQRYIEAIVDCVRATEIDPGYADAHVGIGVLLVNVGNPAQALRYFETAAELGSPLGQAYAAQVKRMLGR